MPVTRNFYVSHQWLRELKRRGQGVITGIYFRIPDDETVWVGHYDQAHQSMTAAEAAATILATEPSEGFEVIIPRRSHAQGDPSNSPTTAGGRLAVLPGIAWQTALRLPVLSATAVRGKAAAQKYDAGL